MNREDALAGGEAGAHDVFDVETGAMHALDDVLHGRLCAGNDVRLHLETVTCHADRIAHAILSVDGVCARDDVDDLPV